MTISRRHNRMKLGMICLIISIFIVVLIVLIVRSNINLPKESSLTSLAFWEDNRTRETGRPLPLPIITIDKVNLKNLTLVITACCRNAEKHLIRFQNNIRAIGNLFGTYRLYLGESDSQDGTLKFIQEWAKNDPNHVNVYTAGHQRWRLYLRKLVIIENFSKIKFLYDFIEFINISLSICCFRSLTTFSKEEKFGILLLDVPK